MLLPPLTLSHVPWRRQRGLSFLDKNKEGNKEGERARRVNGKSLDHEDWTRSHLALWAPPAGSEPWQECFIRMWPSCQVWQIFLRLKCVKTQEEIVGSFLQKDLRELSAPGAMRRLQISPSLSPALQDGVRARAKRRGLYVAFQHPQREAALHRPGGKLPQTQMSLLQQCVLSSQSEPQRSYPPVSASEGGASENLSFTAWRTCMAEAHAVFTHMKLQTRPIENRAIDF